MRLGKVLKGQRVRQRADTWNALMEMLAEWQRRKKEGMARLPFAPEPDLVDVQNKSGSDVGQFGILGIDNVLVTPTAAEATFRSGPVLKCITPDVDDHTGKFVICQEPIANDGFGKGILSGMSVVKINVTDEEHSFADVKDATTGTLRSLAQGAAQILWKESGLGDKWAVVRLGVPPFDIVRFAGVCKIDEANPDEPYPGANVAQNQGNSSGQPIDREWLLVKCERPFESTTDANPGQEAHFPMMLDVTMGGASKYWWEYYLITQDFEVSGDSCATWDTKPTMVWGTDGLIDSNFGLSATLSSVDRHLSCCYPGFGYERTVYGICLRPYLWYLGGTSSNSTHQIDYRKWLVRL